MFSLKLNGDAVQGTAAVDTEGGKLTFTPGTGAEAAVLRFAPAEETSSTSSSSSKSSK